jgi:hypothetical protein
MIVTQIVPSLPPTISGVGDYALNLAQQLHQQFNLQSHFLVGDPSWKKPSKFQGFPVNSLSDYFAPTLNSLRNTKFSTNTLLLHYVGYGYAKRGCPVWLVEGLRNWKANNPCAYLVTMFHEIYASGSPWTSIFGSHPFKKI